MQAHNNLLCIVEKNNQRCFLVVPFLTSRKTDIVPRNHVLSISRMMFVSEDVVLVFYKDDITFHFKTDGSVHHQADEDVRELFEGKVYFMGESEILNKTKYVAFSPQSRKTVSISEEVSSNNDSRSE